MEPPMPMARGHLKVSAGFRRVYAGKRLRVVIFCDVPMDCDESAPMDDDESVPMDDDESVPMDDDESAPMEED